MREWVCQCECVRRDECVCKVCVRTYPGWDGGKERDRVDAEEEEDEEEEKKEEEEMAEASVRS